MLLNVKVEQGEIQGCWKKSALTGISFCAFLGIRYARPPVGELRFKAPVPIDRWDGIFEAKKEGNDCLQVKTVPPFHFTGSEDCLFLNIYTPEIPSMAETMKPVMVFIHGGGFYFGSGSSKLYGPDLLIQHDIIFVSLNYRLHILGFLNLSIPSCPGNVGMKDQALALKWVKENIDKFGGDPNNITLFGESAGATSVHLHMISPVSKGLFHKAIAQSGSVLSRWAYTSDPISSAFEAGRRLGYEGSDKEELVDYLRQQPAEKLLSAVFSMTIDANNEYQCNCVAFPFLPSKEEILEGAFLPDSPPNLVKYPPNVPLIAGLNDAEGILVLLVQSYNVVEKLDKDFSLAIKSNFNLDSKSCEKLVQNVREFYFGHEDILKDHNFDKLIQLYTDLYYMTFYDSLDSQIKSETPVFIYEFKFSGKRNFVKIVNKDLVHYEFTGASHFDEMGYLFYDKFLKTKGLNWFSIERKIVDRMTKMWTNFAKTGNPICGIVDNEWTPCTADEYCFLRIDDDLQMIPGKINEERLEFWKDWSASLKRSYF